LTSVYTITTAASAAQDQTIILGMDYRITAALATVALIGVVCGFVVPFFARGQKASQPATGILFGADNRISTSRAIAFAWTTVIAYVIVALLLAWPPDWSKALTNLYPNYFLLLGGPYGSLVLAKGITSFRIASGGLVKTEGDGTARLSDVIAGDSGRTDLFDSQYVLFNLLAIWFVVAAFFRATSDGFPEMPNGILLLTAGPAAVYLSNKLFGSAKATVTSVTPLRVVEGEPFSVLGTNFMAGGGTGIADPTPGQVLVNGVRAATEQNDWSDTGVRAIAPNVGAQDGVPVDVQIVSAVGPVVKTGALTVDCRPKIQGFNVSSAAPGQDVTMTVDWPAQTTRNAQSCIRLHTTIVNGPIITGPGRSICTFTVPRNLPPELSGRDVDVTIQGSGPESRSVTLKLGP
jgi:hypothetical protein